MKKLVSIFLILLAGGIVFSQTYTTFDITDDVYEVLRAAQIQGLCGKLPNVKPYTVNFVLEKLDEILENLDNDSIASKKRDTEIEIIKSYKSKYETKEGLDISKLNYKIQTIQNLSLLL